MLTANGQIEFSKWMLLEKRHGADKAIAILNEITARMEKAGQLNNTEEYSDSRVASISTDLYYDILAEWEDDDIPWKEEENVSA